MSKVIFREIIISLLVCLAVLLCLSALFYRFIPNNKVLPEKVTYQATEDIKNEINTNVQDNTDAIIKTYEITALVHPKKVAFNDKINEQNYDFMLSGRAEAEKPKKS